MEDETEWFFFKKKRNMREKINDAASNVRIVEVVMWLTPCLI